MRNSTFKAGTPHPRVGARYAQIRQRREHSGLARDLRRALEPEGGLDVVNVTTQPRYVRRCRLAGEHCPNTRNDQGTTMNGAPGDRPKRTDTNEQFEYDLLLRPHNDDPPELNSEAPVGPPREPGVAPQRGGLEPDWDRPEGVDFTEVEYEYAPKMGAARVIGVVCGIAAMAFASLWLVTHATDRSPFRTWAWSTPDLSGFSAPKIPEKLKQLPDGLKRVPEETKRLIARATEAVAPAQPPVVTPEPTRSEPATPTPPTPEPPTPTRSAPPPVIGTPAPATLPVPPARPAPAAPPAAPPVTSVASAPAATPRAPAAASPVTQAPSSVARSSPPVRAAVPPPTPRATQRPSPPSPRVTAAAPSPRPAPAPRVTQAQPVQSRASAPATSAPSRPAVAAPQARTVEGVEVSANPTPTQRAAVAAAAAASTPPPAAARVAVEEATRTPSAPPDPPAAVPPPAVASAASAGSAVAAPRPEAPPAVEPRLAAATTTSSTPSRSPLIEADTAIRDVLGRYRTAFNVLDARAASDVWPTLDQRTLNRAFDQLAEQNVSFDKCAIDVNGVLAQARCTGNIRFVPKIGSRSAQVEPRRWDFTLRKAYGGWVIHEVRAR